MVFGPSDMASLACVFTSAVPVLALETLEPYGVAVSRKRNGSFQHGSHGDLMVCE
jgi:hypothetical protein